MRNMWRIARAEFLRLAGKRSFILAMIGMPLLIGVVMAAAILVAMPKRDDRGVGYVDLAGVMQGTPAAGYAADEDAPPVLSFADESAARAALDTGEIQAFYVLPQDYLATRSVTTYTLGESPSNAARSAFRDLLQGHLVASAPAESQTVLLEGTDLYYRGADDARETPVEGYIVGLLLPFAIGFFFVMVVMSSGGYLLQAVTTEKESRMVEVMMTTVSPLALIGGKAVGLIGVALAQVSVWLLALVVAFVVARSQVPVLAEIALPWSTLAVCALFFLPTYVLLAGLMITIGSMVTEAEHGQQISGLFNLLFILPFFVFVLLLSNPDHPILVALTLFPTTSMLTIAMRWGLTAVPAWQLGLSFALLLGAALASVWVASKVFRLGMLRYGQPLSFANLLKLLRPATAEPLEA